MKSTAVTLIAALLFQILMPGLSIVARELRGEETDRVDWPKAAGSIQSRQRSEEDRAAQNAARIIRSLYEMDVWVMSRRQLDLSKIKKGLYAHVIHTTKGASDTAAGVIRNIDPDGIEIICTATVTKKTHIHYADIDTIVVVKDRPALERWQRRISGRLVVMSRGTLDLSAIKKGWHAYLVYEFGDQRRGELARILDTHERHLVIRSNFAGSNQFWAGGEIALDDIVFIVAAEDRGDIVAMRRARQILRHLPDNPRIRLKSPSVGRGSSKPGSVVGRLLDVNQDTLVMGVGLSRNEVFEVPISLIRDFEINIGRHRNTKKGLNIGLLLGLGVLAPFAYSDSKASGEWRRYPTAFTAVFISLPVFVCSTLIGYSIKTDRWVDVPINGLNMGIAPTRNKGLQAALSFEF